MTGSLFSSPPIERRSRAIRCAPLPSKFRVALERAGPQKVMAGWSYVGYCLVRRFVSIPLLSAPRVQHVRLVTQPQHASLTLLLSCLLPWPLYGQMSYGVSRRTREIGVRVALRKANASRPSRIDTDSKQENEIRLSIYACCAEPRRPCVPAHRARKVFAGRIPLPRNLRCLGCIRGSQTCK